LDQVNACCQNVSQDLIASELCLMASTLLTAGKNDAPFVEAMPHSKARIEASNQLGLILSFDSQTKEAKLPNPMADFYTRVWTIAKTGNVRIIDQLISMESQTHGINGDALEIGLCELYRALKENGKLPLDHPRTVEILSGKCH
jgi:hypothetical protein